MCVRVATTRPPRATRRRIVDIARLQQNTAEIRGGRVTGSHIINGNTSRALPASHLRPPWREGYAPGYELSGEHEEAHAKWGICTLSRKGVVPRLCE